MTTTTHSREAADKRQGMTAGELRALFNPDSGAGIPDDARVTVRVGGRGQIKAIRVEVTS
jgi:hypothetical protein